MHRKRKTGCDLATDHFDLHYSPVYDYRWPSIRAALLSKPKHCALVNNFASDLDRIEMSLAELGAHDFVWKAREKFAQMQATMDDCPRSGTDGVCTLFCRFFGIKYLIRGLDLRFCPEWLTAKTSASELFLTYLLPKIAPDVGSLSPHPHHYVRMNNNIFLRNAHIFQLRAK